MIFEAENITKSFGRKKVLKGVSFELKPGSLYGIVGENGSGKSTLLKIIAGEWKADNGTIYFSGKLGYCPQSIQLFPELTVFENFQFFSAAYGLNKEMLRSGSEELMKHFNFLHYRKEKIKNLSGGTKQKLNLSIALIHDPDLLILDEPYNGFDWDTYLKFWEYTNRLKEKDCTILIITHFLQEKERFERIYNLENGILI